MDPASAALDTARQAADVHRDAERSLGDLESARDTAIRQAAAAGASRRAIAAVVGLSHQRVDQLIRR
jgi:DNA-directed RNA polymerase specialized sigma24 family protein